MAHDFQVTVDCADPHVLAGWWAETLGWVVEPSDEDFIRRMIVEGYAKESDTTTHNGVLVWREGAAIRHPDDPAEGPRRRVLFNLCRTPRLSRTGSTSTCGWARRTWPRCGRVWRAAARRTYTMDVRVRTSG
jgi:hypothetical protein